MNDKICDLAVGGIITILIILFFSGLRDSVEYICDDIEWGFYNTCDNLCELEDSDLDFENSVLSNFTCICLNGDVTDFKGGCYDKVFGEVE